MIPNDVLELYILKYVEDASRKGLLGGETSITELWNTIRVCCECSQTELIDALCNIPPAYAGFRKGALRFEQIRRTPNARDFFSSGYFKIELLPRGRRRLQQLEERLMVELPPPEISARAIGFGRP
jgi:hypothetical protein